MNTHAAATVPDDDDDKGIDPTSRLEDRASIGSNPLLPAATTTEVEADDTPVIMPTTQPVSYRSFLSAFFQSNGALQLLVVSTVFAIGVGSVLGLIPATLADRYARLNHGFDDPQHCNDFTVKPMPCRDGSDDAKAAAAWSHVAMSVLLLLANPVIGSWSDVHGRRPAILLSLSLSCIPAFVFVLLVQHPTMHPVWYYASYALIGAVSYLGIIFAALSDVVPCQLRAQSYGLLLSGFYGGYSMAPALALAWSSDFMAALVSLILIASSLLMAIAWLPETLADSRIDDVQDAHEGDSDPFSTTTTTSASWLWRTAFRPLKEVSILNRSWTLRLLTTASFFAAMVFAADTTLVIYYVEETLNVQKSDIARMTFAMGIAGILVQGGLLPYCLSRWGERTVLLGAFWCGTLHNFLYGAARSKPTIYLALIVSQFTKTDMPLLSSIASKDHCVVREQGRVQSALFATNAIANACGPLLLELVYHYTKHVPGFVGRPGFMFVFAAGLYAVGSIVVWHIPIETNIPDTPLTHDQLESTSDHNVSRDEMQGPDSLAEPLLRTSDYVEERGDS